MTDGARLLARSMIYACAQTVPIIPAWAEGLMAGMMPEHLKNYSKRCLVLVQAGI